MKLNRNITIVFSLILILSVGIVSTNSVTKSVYGQSNTLGQNGGGNAAEQDIDQSQTSKQDNQVVSGDSSVLSGINILCQSQDSRELVNQICNSAVATSSEGSRLHFNLFNNLRDQFIRYDFSLYDQERNLIEKIPYVINGHEGTFEHNTNKAVGKIEISIIAEGVQSARAVLFSSSATGPYACSTQENTPIFCTTENLFITSRDLFTQVTLLG